jgi:hypothetical protein
MFICHWHQKFSWKSSRNIFLPYFFNSKYNLAFYILHKGNKEEHFAFTLLKLHQMKQKTSQRQNECNNVNRVGSWVSCLHTEAPNQKHAYWIGDLAFCINQYHTGPAASRFGRFAHRKIHQWPPDRKQEENATE